VKILIATKNKGKVNEFIDMFKEFGIEVISLLDIENCPDVEETGTTFEENAVLKAETICSMMDIPVISDDSGLVIDALDGRPGVYSARYAGSQKDDDDNMQKVLDEMRGVPEGNRTARFVCALAFAKPDKETIVVEGSCEGVILHKKKGTEGFGYDPIFFLPKLNRTMAEITKNEKNQISHRAQALSKLKEYISQEDMLWQKP
jgi:XTP/dITP diphosphohydrolase